MRTVEFIAQEFRKTVTVFLTGPAIPVLHHSEGWKEVTRLMKQSMIEWQGALGYELQIPVMADGFFADISIEDTMSTLESFGVQSDKFSPQRPPILIIDAGGDIPYDFTRRPDLRWVITSFNWTDYITNSSMNRVRQVGTVTVWEMNSVKLLTRKSPTKSHPPRKYTVRKGDTLHKLAARFYGSARDWRVIAKANKIRDPNHLKVGRVLVIPDMTVIGTFSGPKAKA